MRRLTRTTASALALSVSILTALQTHAKAAADALPDGDGGADVGLEVELAGFGEPDGFWENPCADREDGLTEWYGQADHSQYKTEEESIAVFSGGQPVQAGTIEVYDGYDWTYTQIPFETRVLTHVRWLVGCHVPGAPHEFEVLNDFWMPLLRQETVVPDLVAKIEEHVAPPVVSWPDMDREFGWLYVKAPMDFRIEPPESITLAANLSNVTGSVSAWVTATPTHVSFEPGEPDGQPVTCSLADATAPYSISTPGQCSYIYQNSSAISAGGEFQTRTSIWWEITSSWPELDTDPFPTFTYQTMPVAEAQAVVTGIG